MSTGLVADSGIEIDRSKSERSARLRQAIDDVSLLILHIAETDKAAKPETISELVKLQHKYDTAGRFNEDEEASFWNLFSVMARSCLPATADGIRLSAIYRRKGLFHGLAAYWQVVIPTLATLMLYLVIQIFALNGQILLDDHYVTKAKIEGTENLTINQKQSLETRLISVGSDLQDWVGCWPRRILLMRDCRGGTFTPLQAEVMLRSLNSYVLPFLLGLLGACTTVLRSLSLRLVENSVDRSRSSVYCVRMMLGSIAGATIGLLLAPKDTSSFLASLPPLTAAFFLGYGVEILFSAIDRVIIDATQYVRGKKGADPSSQS